MKLDRIVLRQIQMPLVHFFETSFSRTYKRDIVLVEVQSDGLSGWGEVTAGENPFYNEEWTESAWPILRDYAAPRVLGRDLASAADVGSLTKHIRGHYMARGGLMLRAARTGTGCSTRRSMGTGKDRRNGEDAGPVTDREIGPSPYPSPRLRGERAFAWCDLHISRESATAPSPLPPAVGGWRRGEG